MVTILVTGATGAQGGSVARHLLRAGGFSVRCLTRRPDSDAAQALRQAGAEIVQGDLADAGGIREAVRGCDGVFGVTNFWEHFEKEREHGRNLVDAVAEAGVKHFVFSTLPHVKKRYGLDVPHFDIKAELQDYAVERGVPSTFVHVAFYYENFLYFFPPQKQEDGTFVFGFPQGDTPLAAVAVEDVGGVVAPIFQNRDEHVGATRGIVGDDRPPAEYAAVMSQVLGVTIRYSHMPRDAFASLGFPGAEDLANMFEFNRLHIPSRRKDLEFSRKMFSGLQTFEQWAQRNKAALEGVLKKQAG